MKCEGFCEMCTDDMFALCREVDVLDKIDINFSELKTKTKTKEMYSIQTRFGSIVETVLNVGSGLLTANLAWWWIVIPLYPALNTESAGNIFIVNLIFTAISIIRGLCWRRLFVWLRVKGLWKHA